MFEHFLIQSGQAPQPKINFRQVHTIIIINIITGNTTTTEFLILTPICWQ